MRKTIIIAEAGVNHNGEIKIAKKLVEEAAKSGADFVKFQTFKAEQVVTKTAKKAKYQTSNTGNDSSQYEMIKSLELTDEMHDIIIEHCKLCDIGFLSTGFDLTSLDYLNKIGLPVFKIPSGEITNLPYLRKIASIKTPIILSTGMANLGEIEAALQVLTSEGLDRNDITVLHCNTEYPTPMQDVNLKAMLTIQQAFGVAVGYSDHTLGIEVPIAAVAMGASVIEKHFTLDRNLPGPDHRASLEPDELKAMVDAIRNIELAISGHGRKEPSRSEFPNKLIARKSLHLTSSLPEGTVIEEAHLIALRPGDGISPMEWNNIIGRKLNKDLKAEAKLSWADLG